MSEENLKVEKQLIHLLLNNKDLVADWLECPIKINHFYPEHKLILTAIAESFDKDVLLTRKAFEIFISRIALPKDRIKQEILFNNCLAAKCNKNNFPVLLDSILESYLLRNTIDSISKFKKEKDVTGNRLALKELSNSLQDLLSESFVSHDIIYEDIRDYAPIFRQYLDDVKSGKIQVAEKIICGIREIDDTMVTGFSDGTLTLFCADVSGFKSTMMLNIGLNIWKMGHNVLFVPIEMAREQMHIRATAREANVLSEKLFNPTTMDDEDLAKVDRAIEDWDAYEGKFFVLQLPDGTTVSAIKRQIDKYVDIFKPKVVIVDYVANLEAEVNRYGRNDLEIGDMLKQLRQMGKTMQFAVVSAAQIGREALKRIRKAGATKDTTAINSEDIRGSHEYSADADNIYAQLIHKSQPDSLLDIYVVKARNGKKFFTGGKLKATLAVSPEIGLIQSCEGQSFGDDGTMDEIYERKEENHNTLYGNDQEEEEEVQVSDQEFDDMF